MTNALNISSFLGVPIVLKNGEIFGTLCAIGTESYTFSDREVALFESMATFLSYFIELENTEELYRQVVEQSPDGIMVEQEGKVVYANPTIASLSGTLEPIEWYGKKVSDMILDHETSREDFFGTGNIKVNEQKLKKKDGNLVDVETLEQSLTYKGKSASQIMIRDITKRREIEELINKSEKLSITGQLAAGVAHEIRNPITAIKGFVQLLQTLNEEHDEYYKIVLSEIDRINFIVDEFLYLAKPEKPKISMNDCHVLLKEVVTLLDAQAIMNNVEIITNCSGQLPFVECESNQVKQVFVNIIKNAIEVMPKGGHLYVSTWYDNDSVSFSFTDEGKGIPKERLKRLGEPFYTTKEKGTGLGLMVTRKIIEEHGGELSFSSEVNKGTTVTVSLPVYKDK